MSYTIYNRAQADRDIVDAASWYEEQKQGLGHEFLDELESMLAYIEAEPLIFQMHYKGIRQAPMQRFPYVLLYQVEDELTIILLAVFHTGQNPNKKPRD